MTSMRAGPALLLVGVICLTVVYLRAETIRFNAAARQHESRLLHLRREAWSIQLELGRLKAPDQVRERIERLHLRVGADFEKMMSHPSAGQVATNHH